MIKKCLLMLFLIVLMTSIVYGETQEVIITIPEFDVAVNGVLIDTQHSQFPVITYNDVTYFPMTSDYLKGIGLDLIFSSDLGLKLEVSSGISPLEQNFLGANNKLGSTSYAQLVPFPVEVNGESIDNASEDYPILLYRNITYFPMTWRFTVEEFGWETSWNCETGLSINVEHKVGAIVEMQQEEAKQYELELTYYKEDLRDFQKYINIAIPQSKERSYIIEDIQISPDDYLVFEEEGYGNSHVIWDMANSKYDKFTVNFKLTQLNDEEIDIEKLNFYTGNEKEVLKFLKSSDHIDLNAKEILDINNELFNGTESIEEVFLKSAEWIDENIIFEDPQRDENMINTLQDRMGTCGGTSSIMVALLRLNGIPARNVSGHAQNINESRLTEMPEEGMQFAGHVWFEVYFEEYGWVMADWGVYNQGFAHMLEKPKDWLVTNTHESKLMDRLWFTTAVSSDKQQNIRKSSVLSQRGRYQLKLIDVKTVTQ